MSVLSGLKYNVNICENILARQQWSNGSAAVKVLMGSVSDEDIALSDRLAAYFRGTQGQLDFIAKILPGAEQIA